MLKNGPIYVCSESISIARGAYIESPMSICFVAVNLGCFMKSYAMDGRTRVCQPTGRNTP